MSQANPITRSFDRSLVEGPIAAAIWKIAWPTMLQNVIGGLQGLIDHVMVGHYVGYEGNAAIGVSWQIFLVIIVFVTSMYSGMGVLVARFAGANEPDKVNRVVYQAFLCSLTLALGVMAPVGWFLSPSLLGLINAAPHVQVEALPYLRIMFVGGIGMLMFFMIGGALRAAGDAQTPLRLGVLLTIGNVVFNVILIRGFGPIPALGTAGAALGTVIAGCLASVVGLVLMLSGRSVVRFSRGMSLSPDWTIIRQLFKFGLPTGFQGIAMNIAGVLLLRFIGSLPESGEAQAAYALGYAQLFSFITWSSVGLMGATAAVAGQNLGAGRPERTVQSVREASRIGLMLAGGIGVLFLLVPRWLMAMFGMTDPVVLDLGASLLRFLSVSGLFITVALAYTGGLQGTGDTRSPFYISVVSQMVIPIGICFALQSQGLLTATAIWVAIVIGHFTRASLSVLRFRQEKWRQIAVDIDEDRGRI